MCAGTLEQIGKEWEAGPGRCVVGKDGWGVEESRGKGKKGGEGRGRGREEKKE